MSVKKEPNAKPKLKLDESDETPPHGKAEKPLVPEKAWMMITPVCGACYHPIAFTGQKALVDPSEKIDLLFAVECDRCGWTGVSHKVAPQPDVALPAPK